MGIEVGMGVDVADCDVVAAVLVVCERLAATVVEIILAISDVVDTLIGLVVVGAGVVELLATVVAGSLVVVVVRVLVLVLAAAVVGATVLLGAAPAVVDEVACCIDSLPCSA